jgi:spore germination protein GerM
VPLLTGCGKDEGENPAQPPPDVQIIPGDMTGPTTHKSTGEVTIYRNAHGKAELRHADENGLVAETVRIPIDSVAPAKDAINHLIDDPRSPIPTGTQLRKVVIDDKSGLATVDLSQEFVDNFKGGDKVEAAIINSVRATLGQFSNVTQVQFLVDGKKVAQLGGTIELTDPLPVIRPAHAASNGGATEVR